MTETLIHEPPQPPGDLGWAPPNTPEAWWKRKWAIAVAAFIAGIMFSGDGESGDLKAELASATRGQAEADEKNSALLDERAELRAQVNSLQDQVAEVDADLADSQTTIAEFRAADETEVTAADAPRPDSEAAPAQPPKKQQRKSRRKIAPVAVDWSGNLGPFEVSAAAVGRAKDGTFDVVATITNSGDEVDAAYLTATLVKGDRAVGVADGAVGFAMFDEFNTGETEAAVFVSSDKYVAGVDHVVLEVAFTNKDG